MKLKNLFGMAAMAALVLSGCSNDEVVENFSPENAIEFGTYVGHDASGRASVIDQTALEAQGFGVFAFYKDNSATSVPTVPNFMNNQKVYKDANSTFNNGWTYSPVKYWPNDLDDKIDFYAYAPHEDTGKVWSQTAVNIAIAGDVTNQIDYLYANPVLDQTKQNGEVKFVFNHALSRIGFKVEAVIDDVNTQGNGDQVDNDNEKTEFYDGSTKVTVQEVEFIAPFAKGGSLNLSTGVITPSSDKYTSFTLSEKNDDFIVDINDKGVSTTKKQLNKNTEYLMVVPETLNDIQVRVKYTVTTIDSKLDEGKSVIVNDITSGKFEFPFEKGKAYNFVLHLGLTSVKLSATVGNWEETDVVVNVPINE